jgi:hypothetical protein
MSGAYGPADENESIATIHAASGVNLSFPILILQVLRRWLGRSADAMQEICSSDRGAPLDKSS